MNDSGHRVMRIPLPVPLIREMDAAIIRGVGGYSTRAEFITDAIQERILELTTGEVEDAGPPSEVQDIGSVAVRPSNATAPGQPPPDLDPLAAIQLTVLTPPAAGFALSVTDDLSRPEGKALFGLHNRDYPTLWALNRLAAMATEEPVPVRDYFAATLKEAWIFGELLLAIESHAGRKCTALFPSNPDKRKPAEMGFRTFAIGDYKIDASRAIATSGPLFEWRAVGLSCSVDEPRISLTAAGWHLLAELSGLSVEQPHASSYTTAFLAHLNEHAPADKRGFVEIMKAIGPDGATRRNVLDHTSAVWPEWNENEVSTNAAGYIARAREWGLVEPKQTKSHYHLTPLGLEHLTGEEQ